ncbi:hypothetical protein C8F01DRAFT_1094375 [Mycena amicta]|nr:hypothetical protein C8F01DRAFT_1094375 [Mycena amicta]
MAPRVDLKNLPAVEKIKSAVGSMHKAELVAVAVYSKLHTAEDASHLTKDELCKQLKVIVTNSEDPILAAFGTYRTRTTANAEAPKGRKIQRSDERDKEDLKQDELLLPPTGANKKLIKDKTKTDPPPQFARLGMDGVKVARTKSDHDDEAVSAESSVEDGSSPLSSPLPNLKEHSPSDSDVEVLVSGLVSGLVPQTFYILPQQRKHVVVVELPGAIFMTTWKEILPALFRSISSPIKGDFINVKGVGFGQSFGTVNEILRGQFGDVFQLERINECPLELQGDGTLACQVLCQHTTANVRTAYQSFMDAYASPALCTFSYIIDMARS